MALEPNMDPGEIRELTDRELDQEIRRVREEVFRLRFRKAYQELENPTLVKTLRKDLARLKTIRRERELAAGAEEGASEPVE